MFFLGLDDTDDHDHPMGTGKLARLLSALLTTEDPDLRCAGVIRHQLLVDPRIPYTSHNSPACIMLASPRERREFCAWIKERAVPFIRKSSASAADPGLCIVHQSQVTDRVMNFGISAASEVLSKEKALALAREEGIGLFDLGGTGDGIIGALSAVGLTGYGYAGRFLEYRGILRDLPEKIQVKTITGLGIQVLSMSREAEPVSPSDWIFTGNWLRPRLIGGKPVLLIQKRDNEWHCFDQGGKKRKEEEGPDEGNEVS